MEIEGKLKMLESPVNAGLRALQGQSCKTGEFGSLAIVNRRVVGSSSTCGGFVMSMTPVGRTFILSIWPEPASVSDTIPDRAREFLSQALASLHALAGAVILAASSVDSMLKAKGLKSGTLYTRIDEAATNHLITEEMKLWAHEVRLDANDQRHADESAPLPSEADAKKAIEFAQALAQFLFILPALVTRGRATPEGTTAAATTPPVAAPPIVPEVIQ